MYFTILFINTCTGEINLMDGGNGSIQLCAVLVKLYAAKIKPAQFNHMRPKQRHCNAE